MKTEQLVSALVADRARSSAPVGRSLVRAVAAGAVVSLAIFAVWFGPRVDLTAALATWRFDFKLALVFVALAAAFGACMANARPLASGRWHRVALLAALLAAALLAVELATQPPQTWGTRLVGTNALVCLTVIPLLSLAPLAVLLVALRRTAPASPALAGAAAGALAATAAASIYAFHCFDDSPLFVLTWYPLATILPVAVGAAVGSRLLKW